MSNRRQREKGERETANSCAMILATILSKQLEMEFKERNDKQPYIEFISRNPETGKKHTYMRIDVLCRIFDEE